MRLFSPGLTKITRSTQAKHVIVRATATMEVTLVALATSDITKIVRTSYKEDVPATKAYSVRTFRITADCSTFGAGSCELVVGETQEETIPMLSLIISLGSTRSARTRNGDGSPLT